MAEELAGVVDVVWVSGTRVSPSLPPRALALSLFSSCYISFLILPPSSFLDLRVHHVETERERERACVCVYAQVRTGKE